NAFGLLNTTNVFLPYFRTRRASMISKLSSQSESLNVVGAGIYCASKASPSRTWERELAEFNVKCISIQPGFCHTAVAESAGRGLHRIPEYTLPHHAWIDRIAAAGTERGDPPKAAVKIWNS
ncbi:hypothetical protein K438DRAFT_1587763, partial [Mycena galopus ATCC 62051]